MRISSWRRRSSGNRATRGATSLRASPRAAARASSVAITSPPPRVTCSSVVSNESSSASRSPSMPMKVSGLSSVRRADARRRMASTSPRSVPVSGIGSGEHRLAVPPGGDRERGPVGPAAVDDRAAGPRPLGDALHRQLRVARGSGAPPRRHPAARARGSPLGGGWHPQVARPCPRAPPSASREVGFEIFLGDILTLNVLV